VRKLSKAYKCNICKRFFEGTPDQELGIKEKQTKLSSGCGKTTEIKDTKEQTSVMINYGSVNSDEINWSVIDFCPDCIRAFDLWRKKEEQKYWR